MLWVGNIKFSHNDIVTPMSSDESKALWENEILFLIPTCRFVMHLPIVNNIQHLGK